MLFIFWLSCLASLCGYTPRCCSYKAICIFVKSIYIYQYIFDSILRSGFVSLPRAQFVLNSCDDLVVWPCWDAFIKDINPKVLVSSRLRFIDGVFWSGGLNNSIETLALAVCYRGHISCSSSGSFISGGWQGWRNV